MTPFLFVPKDQNVKNSLCGLQCNDKLCSAVLRDVYSLHIGVFLKHLLLTGLV